MPQAAIMITSAYILDLILGDPRWLPHPVRGIGWMINKSEIPIRKLIKNERIAGIIFTLFIVISVWGLGFFILRQASLLNRYLGLSLNILLIYASLSMRDLKIESMRVHSALKARDMDSARSKLSLIVGRETKGLGCQDIIRATVETVSENIVDGIISPLIFAFFGGAPLALAYKAVNTLDSMVGYKNDRYKDFGWASAKLDDLVNFIPARVSALFLPLASFLAGKDGINSWRVSLRDGRKNPSPNSGIPEAAMAGALGIQLGGLNFYGSKAVLKPLIGNDLNGLGLEHIKESIRITYICSTLVLSTGVFLTLLIGR